MSEPSREAVEAAARAIRDFCDGGIQERRLIAKRALTAALPHLLAAKDAEIAALREALNLAVSRGCDHCADSIRRARAALEMSGGVK